MKNNDADIIKTLREEERLGILQCHNYGESKPVDVDDYENDSLESIFTILRHHKGEDIPTIDLSQVLRIP